MVRKYLSFPKALQFRHEIAKKVREIRKKLDVISEEKSKFQLKEIAAEQHSEGNVVSSRETTSHVDRSEVYGREEDKKQIIDFLLTQFVDETLAVISIVGLGGLGKTALAQSVYNDDEQLSPHFRTKIWVYVSDKFEIKNVIGSIIEKLKGKHSMSMDSMEQELLEQIKRKRFLLVLDDVWTEDYEPWEKLESLLKNGAKGSKVIVTTRSTRVASVMNSKKRHQLDGLPDDDCRKLFQNKAFESDGDCAKNPNLVAIGKEIVQKCKGLPLAAKALGGVLRFTRKESEWREVRDNEIWKQFQNDTHILPALMLSYRHLSPRLKQCFAYCSIFPKGTKIQVRILVQLWVAEGFVSSTAGSQYVDQLISRSLLEHVELFDRKNLVKMHDMVHSLSLFVAGDECSILNATSKSSTLSQNTRYASLVLNKEAPSTAQILSNGEKLRTLHLIGDGEYDRMGKDICQRMVDTIFSNLKCLRALSLPGFAVKELPATMKNLVHLRYLDLSHINDLPQTIVFLHNLQMLNLRFLKHEILSESIGNLVNLLSLEISKCERLRTLPDSIGKLVRLQYLNLSENQDLQTLPSTIGYLKNLQEMDVSQCGLEQLPESIGGLANLLTLDLTFCRKLHYLPESIGTLQNLQKLHLSCCLEFESLPESIGNLVNLLSLDISICGRLRSLPDTMGKLVRLQYLNLSNNPSTIGYLENLQEMDVSQCGLEQLPESIGGLANLLTLDLNFCRKLHYLPESIGTLQNLQKLDLNCCLELESLPESIGGLANLLTLELTFCENLRYLPESICTLQNLQTLNLDFCWNLKSLPESISGLTNLSTLLLCECWSLGFLPEKIGCISNLQLLNISYHECLRTLPESMSSLCNLRELNLACCRMLNELPKNIQGMRSLKHLDIGGCDSLTSMPAGIGQLTQLRELPMYLVGADGDDNASLAELGTLTNLEGELRIKNLQNVKDVAEANAANLREKRSLRSLVLEWDFDAHWKQKDYEVFKDFENKRNMVVERVAAMDGDRVRLLEDVSRSLQPHQNLRDLRIKCHVGKALPGWMIGVPAATNLVELKLESFARCDNLQALEKLSCLKVLELKRFPFIKNLPRLGQLPRLRSLSLHALPRIKCLGSELYGGAGAFPALKRLELKLMLGLEEWYDNPSDRRGDNFLSSLSKLYLRDCPKLQGLPSTFPSVKELSMNVNDDLLLREIERGAFPKLDDLHLYFAYFEWESPMPEVVRRLRSVKINKRDDVGEWYLPESELEMMSLETLERVATEIENKLAINPSS